MYLTVPEDAQNNMTLEIGSCRLMNEVSNEKSKIHRGVIVYPSIISVSILVLISNYHEDCRDSKYPSDRSEQAKIHLQPHHSFTYF